MDYKKVVEDFNNGTIDKEKWQVVMDNDDGYWLYLDYDMDEVKRQELEREMSEKYGEPEGYKDIVNVLEGAGVNAGWC